MLEAAMIQHVREVQNLLTRNLGVEAGHWVDRSWVVFVSPFISLWFCFVEMVKFAALATRHPEIGILPEDGQLARLDVVGVPHAVENAQMELQQHRQGKLVTC